MRHLVFVLFLLGAVRIGQHIWQSGNITDTDGAVFMAVTFAVSLISLAICLVALSRSYVLLLWTCKIIWRFCHGPRHCPRSALRHTFPQQIPPL